MEQCVVVVTGLPGAGKSTLADRLAMSTGAPSISGDWLLGTLAPHGVLNDLSRPALFEVYWSLLGTLMARQLLLGQSAVLDCVVTDSQAVKWDEQARASGGRFFVVECVCSDESLHRRRIAGRVRGIPGWHEIGWDHVERMRREIPPLTFPHTTVDSIHSLDSNERIVLDLVRSQKR